MLLVVAIGVEHGWPRQARWPAPSVAQTAGAFVDDRLMSRMIALTTRLQEALIDGTPFSATLVERVCTAARIARVQALPAEPA